MKHLICLFFFCSIAIDTFSQCSPTISVLGNPLMSSPPSFPSNRIGLDYGDSELVISDPGINISIANADACINSWQIAVSRVDNTINTDFRFWVSKANDGSSTSSGTSINPNGPSGYQEIQTFSQNFFSGTKNRQSVQINYKISGLSVLKTATTYTTTVYYTISYTL
jgi:hypothetical protein